MLRSYSKSYGCCGSGVTHLDIDGSVHVACRISGYGLLLELWGELRGVVLFSFLQLGPKKGLNLKVKRISFLNIWKPSRSSIM